MTLQEAYKEAMNHIAVTEEMRARILKNIGNADIHGAKSRSFPLRYLAVAACFALLIAGALAYFNFRAPVQSDPSSGLQSGILNRVEVQSLQELSQSVGFAVEPPESLPFQVTEIQYTAYGQDLAEVRYMGDTQNLVFRQTIGDTDPSGDYTVYADTLLLELDRISVTLKGESGEYYLAVWQDGTYSYSLQSSTAYTDAQWTNLLEPYTDATP